MSTPTRAETVAANLQPAAEACVKMLMQGHTESDVLEHIVRHFDLPVPAATMVLRSTCKVLQGDPRLSSASNAAPMRAPGQPGKPRNRLLLRVPSLLLGLLLAFASFGGFMSGDAGPAVVLLLIAAALVAVFFVLRPSPRL